MQNYLVTNLKCTTLRIKKKYTRQSIRELEGEWREIAIIFQRLCTAERRRLADGTILEQIKVDSLPIETFMNCVSHIVGIINNDFGAMEVRELYDSLDSTIPHINRPPQASDEEYEYCCNRLYERSVIFGAVYYIISVQNPELQDVLSAIYRTAYYPDARPYLEQFLYLLRVKANGSGEGIVLEDEIIPPHIIPDVQALENGYRHLKPYDRLRKFRQILFSIDTLPPEGRSTRTDTLRLVVEFTIRSLQRIYNLWEDSYVPDNEKVSIAALLEEYNAVSSEDNNGSVAAFLRRVISVKNPSAQDSMYLAMLENAQRPIVANTVIIQENKGSITSIENSNVTNH